MGIRDKSKSKNKQLTVHIDSDSLIFKTHLGMQETAPLGRFDLVPKGYAFSTMEEMLKCGVVQFIDAEGGYEVLVNKIEAIVNAVGATESILYFTKGRCFRYSLDGSTYKENRGRGVTGFTKPRPIKSVASEWIEQLALDGYTVNIGEEWEADDAVILAKSEDPDSIIAATDKDVIYGIAGQHYNYDKREMVDVTEFEAIYHPYKQAIMGDSSDGIAGIKGVGKVGAADALKNCTTESALYQAVERLYTEHGLDEDDLLLNMRLLSMTQLQRDPDTNELHLVYYTKPKGL